MLGSGSAPHCPCSGADNPHTGLVTWTGPVRCPSPVLALSEKCHEVRNRSVRMTMAVHPATREPLWIDVRRRLEQSAVTKPRLERCQCMIVGGEMTVELAIDCIDTLVLSGCAVLRFDGSGDTDTALDGVVDVTKVACADTCQKGCTVGRAFFGSQC